MSYKLIFTLLTVILFGHTVSALTAEDSLFKAANNFYAAEDYPQAIQTYETLLGNESITANVYYNLGNAYYKNEELGEAIWAYEKALKINPAHEKALENLNFAVAQTYDEVENIHEGIGHWLSMQLFQFSINFWSYLSIFASIGFALSLFFFLTTQQRRIKNWTLGGSFFTLALLVLSVVLAYIQKSRIENEKEGVITVEFVDIYNSPSNTAPVVFKLHEGTKVKLERSNAEWREINVNNNIGWIEKNAFRKI